jgi:nuclear GTP-binding protein
LIDCPGVVPPNQNDTEEDLLLRGVVRVEKIDDPAQYIDGIFRRVQRRHLERTYEIKDFTDATEFLTLLARKSGRLLAGGEPDLDTVAKMCIGDFLRGKIPWFSRPPPGAESNTDVAEDEGRAGRLGEMQRKRPRETETSPPSRDGDEIPQTSDDDALSSDSNP